MTDKQIIECPFKGDDKRCNAHLNEVFWWKCYEFDNCLYKKYKAKEQECEKLEKARRLIETSRDKWEYIAKNKERECQDLKGISMKKCPKCGEVYLNSVGMEAFNQLDQLKAQLLDQEAETLKAGETIHKLEQTLAEIKEIAEKRNYLDYNECLDDILQKISEVENEHNG